MASGISGEGKSRESLDRNPSIRPQHPSGRTSSRSNAQLVLSRVPGWLLEELSGQKTSLCDWDYATGDELAYLAEAFPSAELTGIGFSEAAIRTARSHHPHVSFKCRDPLIERTESDEMYDFVFSSYRSADSRRLRDLLETISARAGRALVLLAPFQEGETASAQNSAFDFDDIAVSLSSDFALAHCDVFAGCSEQDDCRSERQVILIYLRLQDPLWRGLTLSDVRMATRSSDELLRALSLESRDKDNRLESMEEELAKLEDDVRIANRKFSAVRKELLEAKQRSEVLESSVRFKVGDAIVGPVSKLFSLLKSLIRLTRGIFSRGSWATGIESPTRATKSPPRPFVYDLAAVNMEDARAPDVGHLFPPLEQPPYRAQPTEVASVLDEFSDQCFRYEADLVRLSPDRWRGQLQESRPELVLVESAWRGNGGAWSKMIESCDQCEDNPLMPLLDYCRDRDIPTVFWNKEDPPNFEHFIDAAARFDYVFTSDRESIPRYRELLGHDRIEALPFAAQPQIHNPVGKRDSPLFEVGFAGTWYARKHEDRRELLRLLLDSARERNLHIFDRMSEFTLNEDYRYPERFSQFLHAALPYEQMLRAYRDFRLFLNVNSVLDSSTMFARRVFEVLACQTNVISTTSVGVDQMLGDVVTVVDNQQDAHDAIARLLDNELARVQKAHLGWRKVMREHTYTQRFRTIADTVGASCVAGEPMPLVSVLVRPHEDGDLNRLLGALEKQAYPRVEILVAAGLGGQLDARLAALRANSPEVRSVGIPGFDDIEQALTAAAREAEGDLLTVFDSRDQYGPEFIWDLVTSLSFANAEVVGKASYYRVLATDGQAGLVASRKRFRHSDRVPARAFLAPVMLLRSEGGWWLDEDEQFCAPTHRYASRYWSYSSDAFNYLMDGSCTAAPASRPCDSVISRDAVEI